MFLRFARFSVERGQGGSLGHLCGSLSFGDFDWRAHGRNHWFDGLSRVQMYAGRSRFGPSKAIFESNLLLRRWLVALRAILSLLLQLLQTFLFLLQCPTFRPARSHLFGFVTSRIKGDDLFLLALVPRSTTDFATESVRCGRLLGRSELTKG